jgi:large conductance mechanosensitive channel
MSVVSEFRQFISRGNVIDLAVGVIIGASFGKIVTALVDGVVMPPIGVILGKVDFSDLKLVLVPADAATNTAEAAIMWGAFVNTIVQFLIVAAAVFLLVKLVNTLRRQEAEAPAPAAPPAPTPSEALLTEIRDLLAKQEAARAAGTAPAPKTRVIKALVPSKAGTSKAAAKSTPPKKA